jgi:hypothetical protein
VASSYQRSSPFGKLRVAADMGMLGALARGLARDKPGPGAVLLPDGPVASRADGELAAWLREWYAFAINSAA